METNQLSLPITANQVINLARQLPNGDKKRLLEFLHQDIELENVQTHWASEHVLGKDWLSETEEKAWRHL